MSMTLQGCFFKMSLKLLWIHRVIVSPKWTTTEVNEDMHEWTEMVVTPGVPTMQCFHLVLIGYFICLGETVVLLLRRGLVVNFNQFNTLFLFAVLQRNLVMVKFTQRASCSDTKCKILILLFILILISSCSIFRNYETSSQ